MYSHEASLSWFIDFRWKLLKLTAVENLKKVFRKIFVNTKKSYFRELLVSVSNDRAHLLFITIKINLVSGFIF